MKRRPTEYEKIFANNMTDKGLIPQVHRAITLNSIKLNRSKQDLISLNNEQLAILNTVAKYLKVGGYLYYSTCSILKSENQDIVTKFLSQNDNFVCQPISSPLCSEYNLGLTFLPHITGGLGFFVCALKRVK